MSQILIFGSSGLTGTDLLTLASRSKAITSITTANRSEMTWPAEVEASGKATEKIIDFQNLESWDALFQVDYVFCCLGTTMKIAGSKEQFCQVDYELPVRIARLAADNTVKSLVVVSALGADPDSSIFYNQTKGRMERDILAINKQLKVTFLRPSLLIGPRKEFRPGEKIAEQLFKYTSFAFMGPLKKYAPNHSHDVAAVMLNLALGKIKSSSPFIEADEISQLAAGISESNPAKR